MWVKLIKQTSNKTDEDIEIERRKSDLLAQRNIASEDQVMKILKHETGHHKLMSRSVHPHPQGLRGVGP